MTILEHYWKHFEDGVASDVAAFLLAECWERNLEGVEVARECGEKDKSPANDETC